MSQENKISVVLKSEDLKKVGFVQIFMPVEQLHLNLEDTMTLSDSEAYVASLIFYNNVKQVAKTNIPGAKPLQKTSICVSPGKKKHQIILKARHKRFVIVTYEVRSSISTLS